LYIPRSAPFDLFQDYHGVSSALKLYVRRVLITEEFTDLMPKYLNFVTGVVDSDDLPLNVSREQLQQMKMIKVMSKKLVRKTIDMISDMADESYEYEDDEEEVEDHNEETVDSGDSQEVEDQEEEDEEDKYEIFWSNFGKNIKLGVIEDSSNRMKLAKLLRFYTTFDDELTSLDEYISRMKDDQDTILYLPGDSKSAIKKSPILKMYTERGYEVLLMPDPIDEFTTQHLTEYEKRKVKSIAKDDVDIFGNDEVEKQKMNKLKDMYKPLTDFLKKHLGKKVEKVGISNKLVDAPLFIFTSQYGYSAQMEKINKAQAFANQEKAPSYMMAKKTLDVNPHHPVMKVLLELVKEQDGELAEDQLEYVDLLF
jgi:heat shock protein beta